MSFLRPFVAVAARRPGRALLLAAALTALLGLPAGSVPTDNSLAVWFVEDDPALARYHAFLDTFGNDEAVVAAYRAGGEGPLGLDDDALALQERAVAAIEAVDGVETVLAPAPWVRLSDAASARPALERLGLAGREDVVAIVARLEPGRDMDARRGRILDAIGTALDTTLEADGRTVHLAGTGVLYEGLNRQTESDGALFLGLAVAVMAALLLAILGSVRAMALTLAGPLAATVATLGLVGWTGGSLNVVMATLPALILVIGIADGLHIFLAWFGAYRERPPADARERRTLAVAVVSRLAAPCLLTSVTTALAFLALASSRMAVIRSLGLYAAVGVLLVWALVVVTMAAGLTLVDVRPPMRASGARLAGWLARLGPWLRRHRAPVLAGSVAVLAVLGVGAGRVVVDTHTLGLLPDDHPVVEDSRWIEANLGRYTPLEFVVTARDGTVLDPAVLARVAAWQDSITGVAGIGRTLGLTDLLALAGERVPGSPEEARDQVAVLAEALGDDLSATLTADRAATRVTAYVPMGTARDFAAAVDTAIAAGRSILEPVATVAATGYLPLYVRIIDYTVASTLTGLALAFAGVFLVLALLLRSWRLVAAAVPPNLLAVATVFGVMGWVGIPLDIATATVGAIILGIAVDDTVHFLHRYRETGRADAALVGAGPAMVLTTVVIVLGFGVLLAAGSMSIVYFGMLITLAAAAALAADLVLLPLLLPRLPPEERP